MMNSKRATKSIPKRNRLLDLQYNENDPLRPTEERRSGRSTSAALKLLSWCMENPGLERAIVDHHNTNITNRHLSHIIEDIIHRLNFQFFDIQHKVNGQIIIKCNLLRDDTDENRV